MSMHSEPLPAPDGAWLPSGDGQGLMGRRSDGQTGTLTPIAIPPLPDVNFVNGLLNVTFGKTRKLQEKLISA